MVDRKRILSQNLKRLMNEQGIRAIDVCKTLNISESTFSTWIRAKSYPRIEILQDLTMYFNCDMSDLVEEYNFEPCSYILTDKEQMLIEVYRNATFEERFCIEGLIRSLRKKDEES